MGFCGFGCFGNGFFHSYSFSIHRVLIRWMEIKKMFDFGTFSEEKSTIFPEYKNKFNQKKDKNE